MPATTASASASRSPPDCRVPATPSHRSRRDGDRDRLDLVAGPARTPLLELAGLLQPGSVAVELDHHLVEPAAGLGDGEDDRGLPAVRRAVAQRHHPPQLAADLLGAVAVGLVDDVDVADLEDAGLGGLDAVAEAGRHQHDGGVGEPGDLDLALADADGLDDHHVAAGRVQHPQRLRRRPGQAAEVAPRGHRPDVDARVGGVVLHPDPVAEQGAAGERRGRVDREHADPLVGPAELGDQRTGGRGLPDARRAGDPDDLRVAGVRHQRGHHLAQLGRAVLDHRHEPRHGPGLTVPGPGYEVVDGLSSWGHGRSGRRPGRRRRRGPRRRRRHRGA